MSSFKDLSFNDRRAASNGAKQAALARFSERNPANDPELAARKEERQKIAAARQQREAERIALKAAEDAQRAIEQAAAIAQAAIDKAARQESDAEEQVRLTEARKIARDARYAARKSRKK